LDYNYQNETENKEIKIELQLSCRHQATYIARDSLVEKTHYSIFPVVVEFYFLFFLF